MDAVIQQHNQKPAAVWNSAGSRYEDISRGIADSIEHCVLRLDPQRGERILDLATGTGWTSRIVARRGAKAIGVDIGADLVAAATERAKLEGLAIDYRVATPRSYPFRMASSMRSFRRAASCSPADRKLLPPNSRVSVARADGSR